MTVSKINCWGYKPIPSAH
uniref:Uncharacterized protein n=1 Tax=Anguilla anguilla TaxID=7936 RepID=A0A0E9V043_ANGAN